VSRRRHLWEAGALLLIVLLAASLRLYRLAELPPGLHFDEAFKGVSARALLASGRPQLFFESDMGEEPIAAHLVAASVGLFGETPWAIRLASALAGILTVPLGWWLGRELARASGNRLRPPVVGLGTALVLAILYWHVSFSRIGMEPILVPLFATLAFAALLRGLQQPVADLNQPVAGLNQQVASPNREAAGRRAWPWLLLAGLAIGGSLYTYKAGYFVPLVAAAAVIYGAIAGRGFLARHRRGLAATALVALLVALPIGIYFATHPANFLQRPASVVLVGTDRAPASPWQAAVDNLPRVLGMFFVQGDANPRSNLPGRPALDAFLALLFLVGVGRAIVGSVRAVNGSGRGRLALALPLLWLAIMVVPTLVTDHAPHFGRAIGATPALALLCAIGADSLLDLANRPQVRSRFSSAGTLVAGLLMAGFLFSGGSTARDYFHTWGGSPDLFYAYDVGLTEVAAAVDSLPADEAAYLTPTPAEHYTLQFLIGRPFSSFDGREGLVLPPPGQPATVVVLLGEDPATLPALQRARPDGQVSWTIDDSYGQPYAAAYHLPPTQLAATSPSLSPDRPIDVTFGGAARLLGTSLDRTQAAPGDRIHLTLFWQALAPLAQDYTVFAHLLGDYNPATTGPLWVGHDGQPDGGHYPTGTWQPGEVILDQHALAIPADTPPGEYTLEAGLYLLSTMGRLPAVDASGRPLPGDAAFLGTLEVR
jgi:4-amino-4-deoxy-L-arabinose transferase-like glycosyltransferase